MDAGANSAPHLGRQPCGDHEDGGGDSNYRKLAEHILTLPLGALPLGRCTPDLRRQLCINIEVERVED